MKKTGITVEVTQELLNNGFTHAAPVPASTGRQRIYQVQFVGEYASSIWHDATEDAYNTFMPERRRIVYAAPVAARELDVEAERRLYEQTIHHSRRNADAWAVWQAARSAAQGTQPESAPVSTEQAGDAWISVDERKPDESLIRFLVTGRAVNGGPLGVHMAVLDSGRMYFEAGMHAGGCNPCIDDVVTHWMPPPLAPNSVDFAAQGTQAERAQPAGETMDHDQLGKLGRHYENMK